MLCVECLGDLQALQNTYSDVSADGGFSVTSVRRRDQQL